MPELPGWTLLVQGGQPRDDGVNIDVQTGELLSFTLVKDDSTSEDDVDMDPDSEDSTDGESDDGAEDGARGEPHSSDFSTASPDPIKGPPPPEPVNRPVRKRWWRDQHPPSGSRNICPTSPLT